jgi:hypothetical protein
MTARNAGKDERALKHGHERSQMLIIYQQTNVDERADDGKSMLTVLIQQRVGICSTAVRRKVLLQRSCVPLLC